MELARDTNTVRLLFNLSGYKARNNSFISSFILSREIALLNPIDFFTLLRGKREFTIITIVGLAKETIS